jgi:hypothetical protein
MAVVLTKQSRGTAVSIGIASSVIAQYSCKAVIYTNAQIERLSVEILVTDDVG